MATTIFHGRIAERLWSPWLPEPFSVLELPAAIIALSSKGILDSRASLS
jgi:hypothetical protein